MAAAIWGDPVQPHRAGRHGPRCGSRDGGRRHRPEERPPGFHPRYHNTFRTAKVPALLVNATALNTGHSWHFTTQSMGESPFSIVDGADSLPRLRRSYYRDPRGEVVRSVTLSQAVAASACVPGLFAPLRLTELYDGYAVGLVDGGVFDNQGALALLQEDCTVLIVSDAAGQLGLAAEPAGGRVSPLLRAMDIFQERMRLASYDRLHSAKANGQLAGLAYVHMKQDLRRPQSIGACEDPSRDGDQLPGASAATHAPAMASGRRIQENLAAIRTIPFSRGTSRPARHGSLTALPSSMVPSSAGWWRSGSRWRCVAFVLWLTWDYTITVGSIALAVAGAMASWLAPKYLGKYSWAVQLTDPLGALQSHARRWVAVIVTWWLARKIVPPLTEKYLEAGRLGVLERR